MTDKIHTCSDSCNYCAPTPTWQERFEDKFCVMLERYTAPLSTQEAEEKIDAVYTFIATELATAFDGLVPYKESVKLDYIDTEIAEIIGWNKCRAEVLRRIEQRKKDLGL